MKKEELRVVPKKNYLILGIILIVSFLLLYYFYMWIDAYNETKLNRPILDKYLEVINYNELDNYLVESPDTIIYVSVLEDSEIRDFEKKFKNALKKNSITRDILYMNITEELKDKNIKKEINNKYAIGNAKMTNVPAIMVFDNGELREIYNLKDNEYDIELLKEFLDNITFSSDGEISG